MLIEDFKAKGIQQFPVAGRGVVASSGVVAGSRVLVDSRVLVASSIVLVAGSRVLVAGSRVLVAGTYCHRKGQEKGARSVSRIATSASRTNFPPRKVQDRSKGDLCFFLGPNTCLWWEKFSRVFHCTFFARTP